MKLLAICLVMTLSLSQFSVITAPFAETIELSGALTADPISTPHFLYAFNEQELYASISFLNAEGYGLAPFKGALLYVNADGTHQVLIGPFDLEE